MINTVRTTISLPRGLKARLDVVGGVNLSALVADAIHARLDGKSPEPDRLREENARLREENVRLRAALARVHAVLDSV
jgi:post-segregation antitoxin (ccd killing protein)